ncbi:hypothetical protein R5R35_013273 [Gryllus longicercus]|uniref:SEFIR domain-containing protein n=1 Tax=Gryllus longicercus TaxID=2509291 RepID=A0AAN9W0T4_9ORTH
MSRNVVPVLILLIVTCTSFVCTERNWCASACTGKASVKDDGRCAIIPEMTDCSDWIFKSNITNVTLGNIFLNSFTSSSNDSNLNVSKANGLNITISNIKFHYLQLQYKKRLTTEASCHVFNISYHSIDGISHNCIWPEAVVGTAMELKYKAYNSDTTAVDEGHYIFRVPNPNRIEPENTSLRDWEFFLYVDISDSSHVTVRWPVPPSHFHVQYYLLQFVSEKSETSVQVLESHLVHVSKRRKQELYTFETDSLTGKFYISVEIFHKNCSGHSCYVSRSPVFIIDNEFKSPLIIAAIGILILLPGFLYVFHSWRRFGALPSHKAPVVLLIYKRTMDTHFRVIVALVMYLRRYCHIRALIEDFDILSADTQDSSSWYREAFSRVDAVMVISSPHHMENDKDKAYYNVNPAALSILEEKSKDAACTLKLLSVILPYCNDKDIPKEAQDLPKFRLPQDLNSILWFIRFGFRTSCFSELEFYLFQSQINGGACDYSRYGKFLRDAVVDANEESRRLWAMLSEAQRV